MRPSLHSPLTALTIVSLTACASGRVTVERDTSRQFPATATYAWQNTDRSASVAGQNDILVDNDIVHRRVRSEIDTVLAYHGWRASVADSAEYLVRYNIGRRVERSTYTSTNFGYGPVPVLRCGLHNCWSNWGWGAYGMPVATTHAYTYPEGTLLIDLVDRKSGQLVFRGIGTEVLEPKDLDPVRLEREIARVLQSLPGRAE
jgi:Domain of unknown function (DUF4136)